MLISITTFPEPDAPLAVRASRNRVGESEMRTRHGYEKPVAAESQEDMVGAEFLAATNGVSARGETAT